MTTSTLRDRLAEIVGSDAVTTDPAALDYYVTDALDRIRAFDAAHLLESAQAQVVVKPKSTEQVVALVRVANDLRTPIIPYGSGTGVMGAAAPTSGGIVLDMRGMNQVLEVRPEDRLVVVQPGMVLEDLERHLARQGLMLGHDPWSLPIATVAGAIGTNSIGYRAPRYGSMGDQVIALEVVLPTGEVLRTRTVPKGPGLWFESLFVGSEGAFGVITEATIRVFAQPEERRFRSFAFATFQEGFAAVQELARLGLRPGILDLSEEPSRHPDRTNSEDLEVSLTLVFEGYAEEVAAQEARATAVCQAAGGQDEGSEDAEQHWRFRHQIARRYKEHMMGQPGSVRRDRGWGRLMDYLHVALPPSQVVAFHRWGRDLAARRGLQIWEAAIWGLPEFYSLLIGDPRPDATPEALARATDEILMRAQDVGGSMEYCHGIGIKLAHLLGREWGVGVEVVRRIKDALDPNHVMNPGKLGP